MKKLLCFVVSFIMLIACTGCNGCEKKRGYVHINEGRYVYMCEGQYLDPEIISNTYDNYRGVIDIKEITKEDFSAANGINVISSDRVAEKYKDGTYYYSITGYFMDKVGNRTDIKYKNLKEKEKPYVYTLYYEDDYGNELYLYDRTIIKYASGNDTVVLAFKREDQFKPGIYTSHEWLTIYELNEEDEFDRGLIEKGTNVFSFQDDQGKTAYFYVYWVSYKEDDHGIEFIFEDLKYEYEEGRSQYRYVDKNMNEFTSFENCVLFRNGNNRKIYIFEKRYGK